MTFTIFISSTMEDLGEERAAATEAIQTLRQIPIRAEYIMPRTNNPVEVCTEVAGQSSVYVGIFKRRYGSIPEGRSLSVTELEYEAARNAQKPIKIFVSHDETDRESALSEFLQRISNSSTGHWRKTFRTIDELKFQITASIAIEIINYYHMANARALDLLDGLDDLLMSPNFASQYEDMGYRTVNSIALKIAGPKRNAENALRGSM